MDFKMYFFKDRSNSIDVQKIFQFFSEQECVIEYTDTQVKIEYNNQSLKCNATLFLKNRSLVPNIYKLNPKYANVNFHIEVPPLLPDFKASVIFNMLGSFARTFDLYVYCELFENILTYKTDVVNAAYQYFKKAYKDAAKDEYSKLYYVEKKRLDDMLNYESENLRLQLYYKEEDIYVPRLQYLCEPNSRAIYTAIEWKENTKTIFPSFVDYVYYKMDDEIKFVKYQDILNVSSKYMHDVPGFMQGTKVVNDNLKKINKIMKKTKFYNVSTNYDLIDSTMLIDI